MNEERLVSVFNYTAIQPRSDELPGYQHDSYDVFIESIIAIAALVFFYIAWYATGEFMTKDRWFDGFTK